MVTQKDIAHKLGVSVALVSRALSGKAAEIGVPEATVEKVRRTARQMGYVPNTTARVLKGASARILGLLVSNFEDPFFGPIIRELQRLAEARDYSLVLEELRPGPAALLRHRLDGLLVIGSFYDPEAVSGYLNEGIPVVCIGHTDRDLPIHHVRLDEALGINLLIRHLYDLGHREVGFLGGDLPLHRQRLRYFLDALKDFPDLEARRDCVITSRTHPMSGGYDAASQLCRETGQRLPSAIVASSDLRAIGVIRALQDAGLHVPGACSVTGFDDIPLARLFVPSLTTIRQPIRRMAEQAFHLLVGREPPPQGGETVLPPELIARESTRRPTPGI